MSNISKKRQSVEKMPQNTEMSQNIIHTDNSIFSEILTPENDYFNLHPTYKFIYEYIDKTYDGEFESYRDNTIALVGDWGSGKSTIIYNLFKYYDDSNFLPIYFNAWEYQKDINFSYSIVSKIYQSYIQLGNRGSKALLDLTKSITMDSSVSIGVKQIGSVNLPSLRRALRNNVLRSTYLEELNSFKTTYRNVITTITNKFESGIIVFIDDLDRCDTDKVLDLLADLRKILSFSKDSFDAPLSKPEKLLKIIFVLAVDSTSLSHAIQCKYGNLIQPNQYLEKIIDRTFFIKEKAINQNFISTYLDWELELSDQLHHFLDHLNYRNPRKIKIMLNQLKTLGILEEAKRNKMLLFLTIYLFILKSHSESEYNSIINPIQKFSIAAEKCKTPNDKNSSSGYFKGIIEFYDYGSVHIVDKNLKFRMSNSKSQKRIMNFTLFALWFGPEFKNAVPYPLHLTTSQTTSLNDDSTYIFYQLFLQAIGNPNQISAKFIEYFYFFDQAPFPEFDVQEAIELSKYF